VAAECDTEESSYQSTLSTRQTRRQGPPGKRGPPGQGLPGQKGEPGELYSDGEKLTALTLMFGEVENKLNIVRTSLCTSYTFSMTERTGSFDEVRTMCVDKGGDLVTAPFKRYGDQFIHGFRSVFNSREENDFWVGITDKKVEGHFQLTKGDEFQARPTIPWKSGQPNGGDCVFLHKGNFMLYDYQCTYSIYGICETAFEIC